MERRTCSECSPRLQRRYGCHRPPSAAPPEGYRGGEAKRFSAPLLDGFVLYECPVGHILREAPWVYDAIEAAGLAENATPREWSTLPLFYRHTVRLVAAERERLADMKRLNREAQKAGRARRG